MTGKMKNKSGITKKLGTVEPGMHTHQGTTKRNLFLEAIERAGTAKQKQREHDAQHGPVKTLWKDGKPC